MTQRALASLLNLMLRRYMRALEVTKEILRKHSHELGLSTYRTTDQVFIHPLAYEEKNCENNMVMFCVKEPKEDL